MYFKHCPPWSAHSVYANPLRSPLLGIDTVDYSLYPSRDYQLVWLRMYLEETALLRGKRSLVSGEGEVMSLKSAYL